MLDDYQNQMIACAALLIAIVIFRRLSSAIRLALVIGTSGTGLSAAIAGLANSTMARIFG